MGPVRSRDEVTSPLLPGEEAQHGAGQPPTSRRFSEAGDGSSGGLSDEGSEPGTPSLRRRTLTDYKGHDERSDVPSPIKREGKLVDDLNEGSILHAQIIVALRKANTTQIGRAASPLPKVCDDANDVEETGYVALADAPERPGPIDGQLIQVGNEEYILNYAELKALLNRAGQTNHHLLLQYLSVLRTDDLLRLYQKQSADLLLITQADIRDVLAAKCAIDLANTSPMGRARASRAGNETTKARVLESESFEALTPLQQLVYEVNQALADESEMKSGNKGWDANSSLPLTAALAKAGSYAKQEHYIAAFQRGLFDDPSAVFMALYKLRHRLAWQGRVLPYCPEAMRKKLADDPRLIEAFAARGYGPYWAVHHRYKCLNPEDKKHVISQALHNSPYLTYVHPNIPLLQNWRNCGAFLWTTAKVWGGHLSFTVLSVGTALMLLSPPALLMAASLQLVAVSLAWPVIAAAVAVFVSGLALAKCCCDWSYERDTSALTHNSNAFFSELMFDDNSPDISALRARAELVIAENSGCFAGFFSCCYPERGKLLGLARRIVQWCDSAEDGTAFSCKKSFGEIFLEHGHRFYDPDKLELLCQRLFGEGEAKQLLAPSQSSGSTPT